MTQNQAPTKSHIIQVALLITGLLALSVTIGASCAYSSNIDLNAKLERANCTVEYDIAVTFCYRGIYQTTCYAVYQHIQATGSPYGCARNTVLDKFLSLAEAQQYLGTLHGGTFQCYAYDTCLAFTGPVSNDIPFYLSLSAGILSLICLAPVIIMFGASLCMKLNRRINKKQHSALETDSLLAVDQNDGPNITQIIN